MREEKRMKWNFLLLFMAVAVVGCAAHKMGEVRYSGFLQNYDLLQPGAKDQAVMVYRAPGIDIRPYDSVLLDRVQVWIDPDTEYKGVDPDELKMLADTFNQNLVAALQDGYTIVTESGPGVLRIRTAITDVVPGSPVAGTTSSIIPVGIFLSATKRVATGTSIGVGQAAVEVEVLDSQTGELFGAAVDRRAGGMTPFKGKFADAEAAIDYWAKRIRIRLDEERGIK